MTLKEVMLKIPIVQMVIMKAAMVYVVRSKLVHHEGENLISERVMYR